MSTFNNPKRNGRPVTWLSFLFMLITVAPSLAQDTSVTKPFAEDPVHHPLFPLYLVTGLLFITIILVVIVAMQLLRILNVFAEDAARETAKRRGVPYVKPVPWWTRAWDDFNASVPVAKEGEIDLGHNFDGIRELDNHLPPWWKGILYGSIIWAVGYLVVYHFMGSLPLSVAEYEAEMTDAAEQVRAYQASQPVAVIDEASLVYTADAAILANGAKVFSSNNCQQCHRGDGGGNAIGPNLTDSYWIHGGSIRDVFKTIKTGVVEKGMPAWGKVMRPTDVRDVAFYVMSLQGTNPEGARKPQGELFEQQAVSTDTTKVSNP
jgi:cytochrome c oxidase cbb3-type subunit 3